MNNENMGGLNIRLAKESDCELILSFIKKLAIYEKREHDAVATVEDLRRTLFVEKYAETLIGEEDGKPVAFALFYHNYSTFLGQPNIHLEDLYVQEECRGKGYGKDMFRRLVQLVVERKCGRLDWSCLRWNKSAIGFYESLGATSQDEWATFRLENEALENLAKEV